MREARKPAGLGSGVPPMPTVKCGSSNGEADAEESDGRLGRWMRSLEVAVDKCRANFHLFPFVSQGAISGRRSCR